MGELAQDGTAESVSRDQILRRERGQRKNIFPGFLTMCRVGNYAGFIYTLLNLLKNMHTVCNPF